MSRPIERELDDTEARAFDALPPEVRRCFLREVFPFLAERQPASPFARADATLEAFAADHRHNANMRLFAATYPRKPRTFIDSEPA